MVKNKIKKEIAWFNYIGLGILVICYLGALWNVYKIKKDEIIDNKKVIRICHWQLELGYRGAMQTLIDKFEQKYPDVKVVQLPISEKTYGQWVTTQLIGRTAPDIIEMGMFNVKEALPRYFIPLTDILRKPNPFNADNPELKNLPWMDTFNDGLQSSYVPELIDYYRVGFNTFSVRIFYNKSLFRRMLNTDQPPRTLSELFDYCERIKAYEQQWNKRVADYNRHHTLQKKKIIITPIASAKYQTTLFKSRYTTMLTSDRYMALDSNCNGTVDDAELFAGLLSNHLIVNDEKYRMANLLLRRLAEYFPRGFMSLGRMDSGFSFIQSNAAMITSGSWDASSYIKQAKDQPFGDIILTINGQAVKNSAQAVKLLQARVNSGKPVKLTIDREGAKKTFTVNPLNADNIFAAYGIAIKDFPNSDNQLVPVITIVDSASPASIAGLKPRKCFEIGVFDFPMPDKSNPVYGKYVVGKVVELASTGGAYGICKFSKQQALALKFLQFCTTPENNEEFNRICQWMPVIRGAKIPKALLAFKPHAQGYSGSLGFTRNTRAGTLEEQTFWPFISGAINYEQFAKKIIARLPDAAARDYDTARRNATEQIPDRLLRRSIYLAEVIFPADKQPTRKNLNKLTATWDVLVTAMTAMNRINAQMKPFIKATDKSDFNRKFFNSYKAIKQ